MGIAEGVSRKVFIEDEMNIEFTKLFLKQKVEFPSTLCPPGAKSPDHDHPYKLDIFVELHKIAMSLFCQLYAYFCDEIIGESILGLLYEIYNHIDPKKNLDFAQYLVDTIKENFAVFSTLK